MKRIICVALAGAISAVAFSDAPALARDDYRGQYWYQKYFGPTETVGYRSDGNEALPRGEVQVRVFDQGFYNPHHLRRAAKRPEIYALARESQFDNEVALMIDARSGDVISAVVLPH